jgi:hypothetical protein
VLKLLKRDEFSIFWLISGILWSFILLFVLAGGFSILSAVILALVLGSYAMAIYLVSGRPVFGEPETVPVPADDPYLDLLYPDRKEDE